MFISPVRTVTIRNIAQQFIRRMDGQDELGVVRLNGDRTATTTDRNAALATVAQYSHAGSPHVTSPGELYARVDGIMDTVADLARQFATVAHRRKALVFTGAPVIFLPTVP